MQNAPITIIQEKQSYDYSLWVCDICWQMEAKRRLFLSLGIMNAINFSQFFFFHSSNSDKYWNWFVSLCTAVNLIVSQSCVWIVKSTDAPCLPVRSSKHSCDLYICFVHLLLAALCIGVNMLGNVYFFLKINISDNIWKTDAFLEA